MTSHPDFLVIAIDGGAASGKSTTARKLAEELDLMHVDTGSYYRSLTAAILEKGINPDDSRLESFLDSASLSTRIGNRSGTLLLEGVSFPQEVLRSEKVNANVSSFAALPMVRKKLFDYQRNQVLVAQENGFSGLVMEGRDIGSVIFPDARVRVFLHADPAVRSSRRAAQGENDAIEARDKTDSTRATAPLTCPDGATSIDTGSSTVEEVVELISQLVQSTQTP